MAQIRASGTRIWPDPDPWIRASGTRIQGDPGQVTGQDLSILTSSVRTVG